MAEQQRRQCLAICKNGIQCKNKSVPTEDYCHQPGHNCPTTTVEDFKRIMPEARFNDHRYLNIVKGFVDLDDGKVEIISTAALFAVKNDLVETMAWLMTQFPDAVLTARDEEGCNVLIIGTKYGQTRVVEWILNDGRVDVHATDNIGRTAVENVSFGLHRTILKLLVNKGGARMADLKKNPDVVMIVARSDLETLKWMLRKSGYPDIDSLVDKESNHMLRFAIVDKALDKVRWMIEEGKSIVNTRLLLVALGDDHLDFDFAIARWLISNGHVDAKQELGNLLSVTYRHLMADPIPRLLRLVEIGLIDNIASEDDAYAIWTRGSVYTTDFLRIMLPRSDPPISVRTRLLEDENRRDFVLSGLELRIRLPEFFNDRYDGLMEKLSPHLPKVLRHATIMLEQGSLSTDEMWETGLGDMTPQRRDELLNFFEVEAAVL
jgi:hypothetical protein